jgi:hypothetical protein
MKLTAEQFADLASSFNPEPNGERQERRRASRTELSAQIDIRSLVDGLLAGPTGVLVEDFSSRGIAIRNPVPLEPGAQFVADLKRHSGGCVSMLCTVLHCRPVPPDSYKVGAEFTCVLAEHPGSRPSEQAVDQELKRIRESVLK